MISKTKIKKKTERKTSNIVDTINAARKHSSWNKIAHMLSGPSRKYAEVNLSDIDKISSGGDTIVVAGKVLGVGNVSKKLRICAVGFSASAKEKLKATKCEILSVLEEIHKNPKAAEVKIVYERSSD